MSKHNISNIAVIGAGTMGHGIALVSAAGGMEVVLHDEFEDALADGLANIQKNLEEGVERGKVAPEAVADTLSRIESQPDLQLAVTRADLVIEAVPERLDLKQQVLRRVVEFAPNDAIIASNTSSLSIDRLGDAVEIPDRFIGIHFFNPVHIMKLVEVVVGSQTSDDVVTSAVEFARSLGKEPIQVKDSPGFATSRLGIALAMEAIRMVEQGVASAEDIDKAMELGYRHPMGPLKLTDLIGLDVRLDIARYLHDELGSEAFAPPPLLVQMVEEGRLGRKSGEGFYEYREAGGGR